MADPVTPRRTLSSATAAPSSPSPSHEFAVLPAGAPAIIRNNTISIYAPNKIQPLAEEARRRKFQALVLRCVVGSSAPKNAWTDTYYPGT